MKHYQLLILVYRLMIFCLATAFLPAVQELKAQENPPRFDQFQRLSNGQVRFRLFGTRGKNYQIDISKDLLKWESLVTLNMRALAITVTDDEAPPNGTLFYRALEQQGENGITGDTLQTGDGVLVIHPINHGTFVMSWKSRTIYVDPVGGSNAFRGIPRPDLILVTHSHGDHFDVNTLNAVDAANSELVVPGSVASNLPRTLRNAATILANGERTEFFGLNVEAVAMYNLTPGRLDFHQKGVSNGYVITIGGKRIYVSGDTEDIPEMRALQDIDVAFVCMNLPFTMTVDQAASAVREFQPKIVYPYHHRGSNVQRFKNLVGDDLNIRVRLRTWY